MILNKVRDIGLGIGFIDIFYLIVRFGIGFILISKAMFFISNPDIIFSLLSKGQFEAFPVLIKHYIVLAHLIGGIFICVGLLTRLSSIVQMPILLGAIFIVHPKDGFLMSGFSLEIACLVFVGLVILAIKGAPLFSIDSYLDEEH